MVAKHENIYTNLEVLPIYNFYKCLSGAMEYIYIDRKGEVTEEILSIWDGLYDEYFKLISNSEHQNYFRLILEVEWLKNRLIYAPILINIVLKTPENDRKVINDELRRWRLPINTVNDIPKCLEILNNSKTKIKRKEEEIEDLNAKNSKLKENSISLEKQSVKLQRRLGVTPDIFKDSVIKWLAYWDELKEISSKK